MNAIMDRFTKRARQALTLAQDNASKFGNNYVGAEHLLLGLLQTHEGVAAQALASLNVDQDALGHRLEQIVSPEKKAKFGKPNLTPRVNRIITRADDERQFRGHQYIGSEHLLLGFLREDDGRAVETLKVFASPDDIRAKLDEMIGSA